MKGVSSYIIPSLAVYLILSFVIIIKNIDITDLSLISIYYIYLSIILGVSAFKFIELGRILRFFIILTCATSLQAGGKYAPEQQNDKQIAIYEIFLSTTCATAKRTKTAKYATDSTSPG